MAWMAENPLPTASMGLAAAVSDAPPTGSGQCVYAVGGTNSSNVLAALAGYDTVQKKWPARPSMPTARSGVAATTSPGRIHVLGGFDEGTNFLTTHEVYEPADDAWSTAAPLPSASHIRRRDRPRRAGLRNGWRYPRNPADAGWIAQPPMSSGRAALAATAQS
jgi:Kelch motif